MILNESDTNAVEAYVFPMFGLWLWDWISGYIALESDLNTVKGVAFVHKGETPGLGARITEKNVRDRYNNTKKIFNRELLDYWSAKDPITTHRQLMLDLGIDEGVIEAMEVEEETLVADDRG